MMRMWPCLMLLVIAQPAWAGRDEGPYYGPMKRWHGIGYKFGYEDRTGKDGSWRIDAAVHGSGHAIDIALYRAAERARDQGYRYLFLLGGRGSRSPGMDAATIYARPSHEAVPPPDCRSRKPGGCYTADVAEILRILGGPDGGRPGTPIIHHRDAYGRAVFLSGYGTGAIATPGSERRIGSALMTIVDGNATLSRPAPAAVALAPRPSPTAPAAGAVPPVAVPVPRPVLTPAAASPRVAASTAEERFQRALRDSQPLRGGDPQQGWTISD